MIEVGKSYKMLDCPGTILIVYEYEGPCPEDCNVFVGVSFMEIRINDNPATPSMSAFSFRRNGFCESDPRISLDLSFT